MKPDEIVKQRFESDCMVACLAMLMKSNYEEAYKACYEAGWDAWTGLGVKIEVACSAIRLWWNANPIVIPRLPKDSPAILIVPSLARSACLHAVYKDESGRVYDPSKGVGLYGVDGQMAHSWMSALTIVTDDNRSVIEEIVESELKIFTDALGHEWSKKVVEGPL